jgi:hypothetical protein
MMFRRIALLVPGLLWIAALSLEAGNVKLQVSSTRVSAGQGVDVKIVVEGGNVQFPDISEVGGYPVEKLRRSSKLETRYVNGKFSTKNKKILSFEFYPRKNVTLPQYTIKIDGEKYTTSPVKIEVSGKSSGSGTLGGFRLQMRSDKQSVYTGEPLIVTVDAVEPLNGSVVQMQYMPPEFKGFFVKPVGGERQFRRDKNTVHELRYLLIPQKAGSVTVSPASIRVGVKDLNAPADPFGIFGAPVKWYSLRSEPLTLEIKPLPSPVQLVGRFELKSKVTSRKVRANRPVNYTLSIEGEGSLEDLDDPRFDLPGVTVYSDDAVVESSIKDGKILSRYTKKYVFISDRDFVIPELTLKEFDYTSGKIRSLKTQSYPIKVSGGNSFGISAAGKVSSPSAPAKTKTVKKKGVDGIPHGGKASSGQRRGSPLEDEIYYAKKKYEEKIVRLYWYLPAVFGMGMMFMFLWMKLFPKMRRKLSATVKATRHYSTEEALKILYPHIDEEHEVEEMVRRLYEMHSGKGKVEIDREKLDRLAARYDREE